MTVYDCLGGTFTWPESVETSGPYTLLTVVSNSTVFSPSADWDTEENLAAHKYNHHTRIAWFKGVTFLAHSSCGTNEGDPGMQTVVHISTNKGVNWSAPSLVVPSQCTYSSSASNTYNILDSRVSYPRNFQTYRGALYLVSAVDQFREGHSKTNEAGEALVARSIALDGTLGSLFRISSATYTNMDGKAAIDYDTAIGPPLMAYSKVYGCWGGSYWQDTWPSEWLGWLFVPATNWRHIEPNTFSSDGTQDNLYRFWRNWYNDTYVVYQQTSTDGGSTWSDAIPTTIPNCPAEAKGIRLTDGRFAILGNPTGLGEQYRDPLYLAVTGVNSTDVTNVWAIRQGVSVTPTYSGFSKAGGAQYVDAVQVGNYLYVSYSLQKESIGFSRVLIPGLADNGNDQWLYSQATATSAYVGTLKMSP